MKKLIFVLFTILFSIVSFLSIKQFEFLDFQSFNFDKDNSRNSWNVEIKEGNSRSKLKNFQQLTEIASKAEVNLQRVSYELTENNEEKIVYYVALYDPNTYFKKIKLNTGHYFNENSDPDTFLSTEQTGNKNQIGQLEIFHSFNPIEIRPMMAAEKTKDIKGVYTLGNTKNVKEFKKIASNYGFSFKISKEQSTSIFTNYPYQNMIYISCFVLCLLILLAMSYDVMNNYKSIAIRYMYGDDFFHIGIYIFRRYLKPILSPFFFVSIVLLLYLYFYNEYQQLFPFLGFWIKNIILLFLIVLFILIITWIVTKNINISQMIKNKKPVKLFFYANIVVRFILAVFIIIGLQQWISTFQNLRDTHAQQQKWDLLKKYSLLGSGIDSEFLDVQNDSELSEFRKLYIELEKQGAVYITPSYYYLDNNGGDLDSNPWGSEGKQVIINENYLFLNPIYDKNDKKVQLPNPRNDEITVLVPEKYAVNQKDIEDSVIKDYSSMLNFKNPESVKVNILYVKNEQSYFTFSTQMAVESKYQIKDPIAIIFTNKFEPIFTSSTIAMGSGYFTKNGMDVNPFKKTEETIEKYNFDNVWKPVTIAYSTVEQKIANDTEKFQLTIIYCVLFLILSAVLLFFSAIYYLEMYKKSLALQWIFGFSFFEKHNLAYLFLLVFWQLSFMVSFFYSHNIVLLIKIALGLLFCDFLFISFLLIIKEHKITKDILLEK